MTPENLDCREEARGPPRPRRRFLRYSVRSLLVVMTLVAIYLGLETHRVIKQRKALDILVQAGGSPRFDYEYGRRSGNRSETEPPGPKWLRDIVGEDYFRTVVSFSFYTWSRFTDDDLGQLVDLLPEVRSIRLTKTKITDEGLRHLERLARLRELSLDGTAVTDAGIKYLGRCRQLLNLHLTRTVITDRGLMYLHPITDHLIQIGLSGTKVTDEGVQALIDSPECTLRWINLGYTHVTDGCVEFFPKRLNLAFLNLQSTQVTEDGASRLKQRFPQCLLIQAVSPLPPDLESLAKFQLQVQKAIYK